MAKLLALLFVALFVVTFVKACAPPGMVCASNNDCCSGACNPFAARCIGFAPMSNGANSIGGQMPLWKWQWRGAAPLNNQNGDAPWNWPA